METGSHSSVVIREAAETDIPRIVEMGRRFLLEGPYRDQLKDNPAKAAEMAYQVLQKSGAKILVSLNEELFVTGVFAFVVFPHYFSGELTAGELIWYVEPDHRGRASMELLWAAERMAADLGAERMQLTAPSTEVGELYRRLKYSQIEVSYQAKLSDRVRPSR